MVFDFRLCTAPCQSPSGQAPRHRHARRAWAKYAAVALTNCKLAVVDQHRFSFMVDEVPFFAIRVMKVMADRLRRKEGPQPPLREPATIAQPGH